jgi:MinD-like ATPase involved in chromosome partitioning or flagellar assembly
MGKTIGVVSLKGGVGKTSVVSALGDALAGFGKKVLLIDGNLSSPTLGLHLNVVDPDTTIHHVLSRDANIKDAIHQFENFDIIPASIFNRKDVSPLKLKDNISPLKRKYDMILVDSAPSLDEETLGVMLASDGLLVVTTPDHPTLSATMKAVKLAQQRGTPINGLVLNKVHNKGFELSLDEIEKALKIPILASIPHDINVLKSLSELVPSTQHKPNSEASQEYKKLAAALIGEKYKPRGFKNFFRRVTPKRQDINREVFYDSVFK